MVLHYRYFPYGHAHSLADHTILGWPAWHFFIYTSLRALRVAFCIYTCSRVPYSIESGVFYVTYGDMVASLRDIMYPRKTSHRPKAQ